MNKTRYFKDSPLKKQEEERLEKRGEVFRILKQLDKLDEEEEEHEPEFYKFRNVVREEITPWKKDPWRWWKRRLGLPLAIETVFSPEQQAAYDSIPPSQKPLFLLDLSFFYLIKSTMETHGFRHESNDDFQLHWAMQPLEDSRLQKLRKWQRSSSMPRQKAWSDKQQLSANFKRMQEKFGPEHFHFHSHSFNLPEEYEQFALEYQRLSRENPKGNVWISKEGVSAWGRGIVLHDDINAVDKKESRLIQTYIRNPLLMNNKKYDLRVYVLVTSWDPLTIYVYQDGQNKMTTFDYRLDKPLDDRAVHMTNAKI